MSWLWEKQRTSLWLVVLVCENYRDFTSLNSAFDIAEAAVRQKVGPEATIDYRRANQYFHDLHLMDVRMSLRLVSAMLVICVLALLGSRQLKNVP